MSGNPGSSGLDGQAHLPAASLSQRTSGSAGSAGLLARSRAAGPPPGIDAQNMRNMPAASAQLGTGKAAGVAQLGIGSGASGPRTGASSSNLHGSAHADTGRGGAPATAAGSASTSFFHQKLSSMQPKQASTTPPAAQSKFMQHSASATGQASAKPQSQTPHDNPLFGNLQVTAGMCLFDTCSTFAAVHTRCGPHQPYRVRLPCLCMQDNMQSPLIKKAEYAGALTKDLGMRSCIPTVAAAVAGTGDLFQLNAPVAGSSEDSNLQYAQGAPCWMQARPCLSGKDLVQVRRGRARHSCQCSHYTGV